MTTEQLIRHLATCRRRIKYLRDEHQRLWEKSELWKRKSAQRRVENNRLRMKVRWLEESRDSWKAQAMAARPPRPSTRTHRPAIQLRPGDLDLILEMPARD